VNISNEREATLDDLQSPCHLCPRGCAVLRHEGERGYCGTTADPIISSAGPHYGEETILVGRGGSGTIFLSGCNLRCAFCQNWDIAHSISGSRIDAAGLAAIMLRLEALGCENVNFVTPTHHAPQIRTAVVEARKRGFSRPVVYNCGGYESVEALRLMEGVIDIYMPDAKFFDPAAAQEYMAATDYPERVREALAEMHRQVGALVLEDGVATRGLLVRHLVMPSYADDSKRIMDFLEAVGPGTFVNVMGQYRPMHRAGAFRRIDRPPTASEVREVREYAIHKGLRVSD
jgi:putative pyruvate formate lyase activating enzyme